MPEYFPDAQVLAMDMVRAFGLLQSPPIAYYVPSTQINGESNSSISGGRFHKARGQVQGIGRPKAQDNTLSTGKNTGRIWTAVSGTWKDTSKSKDNNNWRLLMPDATASVSFEITSDASTSGIENATIIIGRGVVPSGATPTKSNYNCYLELAYGSTYNFRLAFEWMSPIRLEMTDDGGSHWYPVGIARDLGDFNTYLKNNNYEIVVKIEADTRENTLYVEFGSGSFARNAGLYSAAQSGQDVQQRALPTSGRYRFYGQNGWASLETYPLRYDSPSVKKSTVDFGRTVPGLANASVVANSTAKSPANQTLTPTISSDGRRLDVQVQASLADAGDGLGSTEPARISDFTVIVPAQWIDSGGVADEGTVYLRGMRVEELQICDVISRTRGSSATITNWNKDGLYNGAYGHIAVNLMASNGAGPYFQRMLGIGGVGANGIEFEHNDPTRLMHLPVADRSYAMGSHGEAAVPLGQEVVLDGWPLRNAIQFLCEIGNTHPRYLVNRPTYLPPNAPANAPYGPAGDDCPDFILPRGTGSNPRFRYLPDRTPWSVLQEMVQDTGDKDPWTGLPVPYMMGFDPYGNFRFEPFDPLAQVPVITYSSVGIGDGQILPPGIKVYNSVNQMRTELTFMGIDASTYELLVAYLPMSPTVLATIGFRFPWIERNARYASPAYLRYITQAASVQASIPQIVARFPAVFAPYVKAGDVCIVQDDVIPGGSMVGVIEELHSIYGTADVTGRSGINDCYSWVTVRSLANFI